MDVAAATTRRGTLARLARLAQRVVAGTLLTCIFFFFLFFSQGELRGDAAAEAGGLQRRGEHQHLLEDAVQRSPGRQQQKSSDVGQQAHHLVW